MIGLWLDTCRCKQISPETPLTILCLSAWHKFECLHKFPFKKTKLGKFKFKFKSFSPELEWPRCQFLSNRGFALKMRLVFLQLPRRICFSAGVSFACYRQLWLAFVSKLSWRKPLKSMNKAKCIVQRTSTGRPAINTLNVL